MLQDKQDRPQPELSEEEVEEQQATELPEREAMSLVTLLPDNPLVYQDLTTGQGIDERQP